MNILVMDDIERDRSVLIDKTKKWGALHSVPLTIQEMTHAACNSPAMRTYQDVDVIFLDIEMPGLDGMSLAKCILIVITGQDDLLLELNLQRSPGFLAICLLVKLCDIIFFIFVTRKRISTPISDKIILRFLLLPVLSAIIGMVMVNEMSQGKASGGLFLLLIFFMILCDIIAVDLMFATSKSVKQVVEAESKVKINEISKTQYLRLAEKSDTIRTWKHDTREAMNGALLLMQQGRTAEAELLLKDRLASMQVETIAIKSGNIIVDAILTQKIDECLDNGIVLDMKVEIPSHIMREEDTCEVFGSILDFAVAVSNKQPTDKKIKIVLQDQDNKLKVFVTANAAVFDTRAFITMFVSSLFYIVPEFSSKSRIHGFNN